MKLTRLISLLAMLSLAFVLLTGKEALSRAGGSDPEIQQIMTAAKNYFVKTTKKQGIFAGDEDRFIFEFFKRVGDYALVTENHLRGSGHFIVLKKINGKWVGQYWSPWGGIDECEWYRKMPELFRR